MNHQDAKTPSKTNNFFMFSEQRIGACIGIDDIKINPREAWVQISRFLGALAPWW